MRLKSSVRRKVENRIVTEYLGFKKYFFLKMGVYLERKCYLCIANASCSADNRNVGS